MSTEFKELMKNVQLALLELGDFQAEIPIELHRAKETIMRLNQEIGYLRKENVDVEKQKVVNEEWRRGADVLNRRIEELVHDVAVLQSERKLAEFQSQTNSNRLTAANKEKEALEKRIEGLEAQLKSLTSEPNPAAEVDRRVQNLVLLEKEREIKELIRVLEDLNMTNTEMGQEIAAIESERMLAESQNQINLDHLTAANKEKEALEKKIEELEAQLKSLSAESKPVAEEDGRDRNAVIEEKDKEIQGLKIVLMQLNMKADVMSDENRDLKKDIGNLKYERCAVIKRNDELARENELLRKFNEKSADPLPLPDRISLRTIPETPEEKEHLRQIMYMINKRQKPSKEELEQKRQAKKERLISLRHRTGPGREPLIRAQPEQNSTGNEAKEIFERVEKEMKKMTDAFEKRDKKMVEEAIGKGAEPKEGGVKAPWKEVKDSNGYVYYLNTITKQTQWNKPKEEDQSGHSDPILSHFWIPASNETPKKPEFSYVCCEFLKKDQSKKNPIGNGAKEFEKNVEKDMEVMAAGFEKDAEKMVEEAIGKEAEPKEGGAEKVSDSVRLNMTPEEFWSKDYLTEESSDSWEDCSSESPEEEEEEEKKPEKVKKIKEESYTWSDEVED